MDKKILAIIPARGGSKGVTRKNVRNLAQKPLIAYTIEAAKTSKYLDRIIVSTDDEEISCVSKSYGAEVPFFRPIELAQDDTPGIEPILHCLNWLVKEQAYVPDYVCVLQCTSPLRNHYQINQAIEEMFNKDADSIISVYESDKSPYWMKKIKNGKLVNFLDSNKDYTRRQDIPKAYMLNGAIYICKTEMLIKNRSWYSENTIPYIMDKITSVDIDDIDDFRYVEYLMKEGI